MIRTEYWNVQQSERNETLYSDVCRCWCCCLGAIQDYGHRSITILCAELITRLQLNSSWEKGVEHYPGEVNTHALRMNYL